MKDLTRVVPYSDLHGSYAFLLPLLPNTKRKRSHLSFSLSYKPTAVELNYKPSRCTLTFWELIKATNAFVRLYMMVRGEPADAARSGVCWRPRDVVRRRAESIRLNGLGVNRNNLPQFPLRSAFRPGSFTAALTKIGPTRYLEWYLSIDFPVSHCLDRQWQRQFIF